MDFARHLLIDAYNVIHQWPETKRALVRDRAIAREMLAAAVRILHDRDRIRVTLVFDGKGPEITVERPGESLTFSYLYSPSSMSADDVIEQIVGASLEPETYLVVTRDLAERRTIEALGGTVLTPEELLGWITRSGEALNRDLAERRKTLDAQWKAD